MVVTWGQGDAVLAAFTRVRIAALCDGLAQSAHPLVELNRGVAVAQAFGPHAGLKIVLPLLTSRSFASTTCCRRSPATCADVSEAWSCPEAVPPCSVIDQQHPGT